MNQNSNDKPETKSHKKSAHFYAGKFLISKKLSFLESSRNNVDIMAGVDWKLKFTEFHHVKLQKLCGSKNQQEHGLEK